MKVQSFSAAMKEPASSLRPQNTTLKERHLHSDFPFSDSQVLLGCIFDYLTGKINYPTIMFIALIKQKTEPGSVILHQKREIKY